MSLVVHFQFPSAQTLQNPSTSLYKYGFIKASSNQEVSDDWTTLIIFNRVISTGTTSTENYQRKSNEFSEIFCFQVFCDHLISLVSLEINFN